MKLVLIRHGESEWNLENRFTGWKDVDLSPKGIEEAKSAGKILKEMKELLDEYNSKSKITFDDIVDFHYKFEAIHPFQDGNGRVGRLIMFKECLRNDIIPFIIDEEHKLFYYRGLKNYEKDKTYLIETCLSTQDKYIKLLNDLEIFK